MKKLFVMITVIGLIFLMNTQIAYAEGNYTNWMVEDGSLYCYVNGEKVTGPDQRINGIFYSFTEDGALIGNDSIIEIDSDLYYLGSDNKIITGWQTRTEGKYYFNPDTGKASKGIAEIDGIRYGFSSSGTLVIDGWLENRNRRNYAHTDDEGRLLTGYQQIGEAYYFFDDDGLILSGIILVNGEYHYFSDCEYRGWVSYNGALYYFSQETGAMQTEDEIICGIPCRFTSDGMLIYYDNIVLIDYYSEYISLPWGGSYSSPRYHIFGFDIYANKLSGWKTINDNTYFFDYGEALIGFQEFDLGPGHFIGRYDKNGGSQYSGAWVYFDQYGILLTGWQNIDVNRNGWITRETFYFDPENGVSRAGWKTIDGATYYFGRKPGADYYYPCMFSDGKYSLTKDGVTKDFYFDKDGKLHETHTAIVGMNGKEPTYSEAGFTQGTICSVCEEIITPPTAIPALKDLSVIYIPANIKEIESEAFAGLMCEAVIIPEGCQKIGSRAFANCENLIYVHIPSSVTSLADNAFEGCNENVAIFKETE